MSRWLTVSSARQAGMALLLMALGAGIAIGVQRWEPWDSGSSPAADTPSLEAVDVLNLFVAACKDTSAYDALMGDFQVVRAVLAAPPPPDTSLDWLVRHEYPAESWLDRTFNYEGEGWWRIKFVLKTGLWRIHEETGEVRPPCI